MLSKKSKDTKGVVRIHKSNRDIQYNDQKGTKGQAMIYKTLHRKLNIE